MSPAQIPALDPAEACRIYAARLVRMTGEQLAVEAARIEALPGSAYRHLVDEELEIRRAVAHDLETAHAALLASTTRPTATGGVL